MKLVLLILVLLTKLLTFKMVAGALYCAFGQTQDLEAVFKLKEKEGCDQLVTSIMDIR